jgi:anti-sigma28 factor (negative regulator of flagellin synthesis)
LKIKGSGSQRIRELYKKTTQGVKTSGTKSSGAADGVSGKSATKVSNASTGKPKAASEARYDDVLAQIDARTEDFAVRTVARASDVRKAKVEAIAEAIKNKTYKVDFEAVAERMLASGVFNEDDHD